MNLIAPIAFTVGFLITSGASASQTEVINVVDGDTIRISADFLPPTLGNTLLLRIDGVDTPEKGYLAKCQREQDASKIATEATRKFVEQGHPRVILHKWDKYGGRVLGDIEINNQMLSTYLIANKYARPYDGGKKSDWCADTK